ncbi:uncharacterized protein LOC110753092 [Prunus avium]|uniref:Uncharacterized protein LOC110753092 n=1 Tax=Prunus avium TaxID=42229 RepID=A0A6P5S728_PRUAV|nr:uncharacterized protein LOC110753092 [Prunus avium]
MESSATDSSGGHDQIVSKKCNSLFPALNKYRFSSRRTPSSSSSSSSSFSSCSSSFLSSSSCNPDHHDSSPLSQGNPLRFSGVPFSWEHFPGIPKKLNSSKKESYSSLKRLPLPPPTTTTTSTQKPSKKFIFDDIGVNVRHKNPKGRSSNFAKDPFLAALVECSKDAHDDDDDEEEEESNASFSSGAKVSRSSSERFGFVNLYTSCKRTCAVSESIIDRPRPSRTSYDPINRLFR